MKRYTPSPLVVATLAVVLGLVAITAGVVLLAGPAWGLLAGGSFLVAAGLLTPWSRR